jgi:hypothetical protein
MQKILYSQAGHKGQTGALALHAGYLSLQTHCVSTATMVAKTRLSVTLYVHCLSRLFSCEEASIIGVIRIRRIRQQDMQDTYGM